MTFVCSLSQMPDEKKIAKQLRKIIFGTRPRCPDCMRQMYVKEIQKNRLWRCRKCRNKFSLTSVTWLKGMKISLKHLWALIWCWQKKLNVQQVQELMNISIPTIRRYYELFRDHLQLDFEVALKGKVQMDEMFVKGAVVVGAKDIRRRNIKLIVVNKKAPDKSDAMNLIFHYVKPKSRLFTDGSGIYSGCEKWWPLKHRKDIHKKWEFALTSEIEGIWANLRTFIRRMYHHTTPQYLPEYVSEFCVRFSSPEIFISPNNYLQKTLRPVPTC